MFPGDNNNPKQGNHISRPYLAL